MKDVSVSFKGLDVDYEGGRQMTMGLAKRENAQAALLVWFDKKKNRLRPLSWSVMPQVSQARKSMGGTMGEG
jgi:hypothetical protein